MRKYLYFPCVAILALAACDDKSDANQQQSQVAPPSVTETAVQESVARDGSAPVAEVTEISETAAPVTTETQVEAEPAADASAAVEKPAADSAPASVASTAPAAPVETTPAAPPESNAMASSGSTASMTPPVTPSGNPNPAASDKGCGDYNGWVGQKVDEKTIKATGKPYRIVKPGASATTDNPKRLSVEIDPAGTVMRVWCG